MYKLGILHKKQKQKQKQKIKNKKSKSSLQKPTVSEMMQFTIESDSFRDDNGMW